MNTSWPKNKPHRFGLLFGLLMAAASTGYAQIIIPPIRIRAKEAKLIKPEVRQPAIYFPQAPLPGEWRKSIGLVFTSTPPEITEEVRVSVPALDVNLQKGLSKRWFLVSRLQSQLVQNNLAVGVRWAVPLSGRVHVSAGSDVAGWFGALRVKDVFNTQAYGLQAIPHVSVGYRLTRDLQLTVRGEALLDLYYQARVGSLDIVYNNRSFNGAAIAFVLEQPFYGNQHVTLGLRAAYSNFNWQFWSLYDTFDRNLFYPQLFFGFIL